MQNRSGRGNAFLEPAVPLVKSMQRDIASLGKRLEAAAATEEAISSQPVTRSIYVIEQQHAEMKGIIDDIKSLLARVDREIQFIQLAITGSGETLSSSMPPGISPSRLLQASAFLNMGDCQFASDPTRPVQIGPSFTLSLYMLFLGHSSSNPMANGDSISSNVPATTKTPRSTDKKPERQEPYGLGEGERRPIWQEVIHKARFRLCRTPPGWVFDRKKGYCTDPAADATKSSSEQQTAFTRSYEYCYHLEIIEDLDDGRLHEEDGPKHQPFDNIPMAGIRESLSVNQISKIFYTNTGKLLNIGSSTENNPVLLLKRDVKAESPSQLRRVREEQPCSGHVEGTAGSEESDSEDDDQSDIDRQLFEESEVLHSPREENGIPGKRQWEFPQHVDQEWLALEVFVEDEDDDSDDDDDTKGQRSETPELDDTPDPNLAILKARLGQGRSSSVDNNLLEQIRNISIRSPVPSSPQVAPRQPDEMEDAGTAVMDSPESFVARSPFGAITSSLSLLEMLIRLTSLQQFQQTSHLAIPDYILTFFLEETSTTGLKGEQRWKVRSEAKKRVGFDPYTDTPTRETVASED
jgi:hypothetical protein